MKNKNKRELEKRWASEAAKQRKAAKKKTTRQKAASQEIGSAEPERRL